MPEAVAGCAFVLHVASPFPTSQPRNEDDLIVPAREGALRVLRARARRRGRARRAHLLLRGDRLRHAAGRAPVHRGGLDRSDRRRHRLRAVEDARRAGGLGLHRERGRRPRLAVINRSASSAPRWA
ncbi:MAG: hypothetical protein WDM88_04150 [Galbitalea sp.]